VSAFGLNANLASCATDQLPSQ